MSKFLISIFFVIGLTICTSAFADKACKKCEKLRDYHKDHPNKFAFYEDYVDAKDKGEVEEVDLEDWVNTELTKDIPSQEKPEPTEKK